MPTNNTEIANVPQEGSCSGAVSQVFQEIPAPFPFLSPFSCTAEVTDTERDSHHLELLRALVIWQQGAQWLLDPRGNHQATSALEASFCNLSCSDK